MIRWKVTAHYQFEAIHPFPDGNGWTGRTLNVLILVEQGLLQDPVLHLSRHLIRNKNEYYDRLLAVTNDGDWESWITFMLEGVRTTSLETLDMIGKIEAVQEELLDGLRTLSTRGNIDLLNLLFEQPYTRISDVMHRCEVSRPTATKWLTELVDAELLDDARIGREMLFINRHFLSVLTRSLHSAERPQGPRSSRQLGRNQKPGRHLPCARGKHPRPRRRRSLAGALPPNHTMSNVE